MGVVHRHTNYIARKTKPFLRDMVVPIRASRLANLRKRNPRFMYYQARGFIIGKHPKVPPEHPVTWCEPPQPGTAVPRGKFVLIINLRKYDDG